MTMRNIIIADHKHDDQDDKDEDNEEQKGDNEKTLSLLSPNMMIKMITMRKMRSRKVTMRIPCHCCPQT